MKIEAKKIKMKGDFSNLFLWTNVNKIYSKETMAFKASIFYFLRSDQFSDKVTFPGNRSSFGHANIFKNKKINKDGKILEKH